MNAFEREAYFGADCPHPTLRAVGWSRQRRARRPALVAHEHTCWEFCLLVDGRVDWWVEDERWTLAAGHAFVTAPGERHGAVDEVMAPCSLLWCQVDDASAGAAWRGLPRSWAGADDLAPRLRDLLAECRRPDAGSPAVTQALVTILVEAVRRSAAGQVRSVTTPSPLARLESALRDDPSWWPGIVDCCRRAGLSRTRLFTLARRHWQAAPLVHLARLRVRLAGERLLREGIPITALAHDFGYASSQHFATAFRRETGLSPTAWRREHING